MDLYLASAGQPRAKDWFPDNIPGLYRLSKGEIGDDIDFIQSNVGERNLRRKRKNKEEKRNTVVNTEEERLSKRARLQAKAAQAKKIALKLKTSHQSLRQELQTTRADIASSRSGISRTRRSAAVALSEKKYLQAKAKESLKSLEKVKEKIAAQTNESQRYKTIRTMMACIQEKDAAIASAQHELQLSLQLVNHQKQLVEEYKTQIMSVEGGEMLEPVKQLANQLHEHFKQLEQLERQNLAKKPTGTEKGGFGSAETSTLIVELNDSLEEQRTINNDLEDKIKKIDTTKEDLEKNMKALQRELEQQKKDLDTWEIKRKNFDEILLVVEGRSEQAEDSLREVMDEVHVLRTGNDILQCAYNKLLLRLEGSLKENEACNTPIAGNIIDSQLRNGEMSVDELTQSYIRLQALQKEKEEKSRIEFASLREKELAAHHKAEALKEEVASLTRKLEEATANPEPKPEPTSTNQMKEEAASKAEAGTNSKTSRSKGKDEKAKSPRNSEGASEVAKAREEAAAAVKTEDGSAQDSGDECDEPASKKSRIAE